ncbi:MAG: carboxylating nicotinate-nucleotide diphosphorylase [Candidatus Hodarchaeales archaeon]|jgi:nicotinate-nucleotide pyrophosphorylase (carboxylating)
MIQFESFIPEWKIKPIIENFLNEDIPYWDITSVLVPSKIIRAEIVIKEAATVAGTPVAKSIFDFLGCVVKINISDSFQPKIVPEKIMEIEGTNTNILQAERLALNFLGRLSAIASSTTKAISIINERTDKKNIKPTICSTRKTTPGLRLFEKYAVIVGGGDPHRFSLSDAVMLKNNHLKMFNSVMEAVKTIKNKISFVHKIEVETESLEQSIEAAKAGVDIIMLDNFPLNEIKDTVEKIKSINNSILVEVSGGINLSNLKNYTNLGIDCISMGSLTHSQRNVDYSLRVLD